MVRLGRQVVATSTKASTTASSYSRRYVGAAVPDRTRGGSSSWTPPREAGSPGCGDADPAAPVGWPQIVDDGEPASEACPQRRTQSGGHSRGLTAEQQCGPHVDAAVAVDGHHDVDVTDERGERRGRCCVERYRGHMPVEVGGCRTMRDARARCAAREATVSVPCSRLPPCGANSPNRPRSSQISSTPGCASSSASTPITSRDSPGALTPEPSDKRSSQRGLPLRRRHSTAGP